MNLLRKLKVLVLLFAVLVLILGFKVLNVPKTAEASGPLCYYWVCTIEGPPIYCWHVCRPCPTFP